MIRNPNMHACCECGVKTTSQLDACKSCMTLIDAELKIQAGEFRLLMAAASALQMRPELQRQFPKVVEFLDSISLLYGG